MSRSQSTPVTVISGNLGAGKTTLLNRLLETTDRRLAILVNDMGDVNIDAALLEGSDLARDGIAELSNGCICCELQDDLATEVRKLATRYDFEHLVVESSGISEPAPVARLFTVGDAAARYTVDALVTVVDAAVLSSVVDGEKLERETPTDAQDRPLADLLVEQIEVSNIVLLNKCDLVESDELERLEAVIGQLQPSAEIVRTEFSDVPPERILGRELFDPEALGALAGWQQALADERVHERGHRDQNEDGAEHDGEDGHDHEHRTPESVYGVDSMTYRRTRPLDPDRFSEFLGSLPPEVIRLKGSCWIAGRPDLVVHLSGAGRTIDAVGEGPWIASLPRAQQTLYRENHSELPWDETHGDRRTELVFIGTEIDPHTLETELDDCLLDPDCSPTELAADPFPIEEGERTIIRTG